MKSEEKFRKRHVAQKNHTRINKVCNSRACVLKD